MDVKDSLLSLVDLAIGEIQKNHLAEKDHYALIHIERIKYQLGQTEEIAEFEHLNKQLLKFITNQQDCISELCYEILSHCSSESSAVLAQAKLRQSQAIATRKRLAQTLDAPPWHHYRLLWLGLLLSGLALAVLFRF